MDLARRRRIEHRERGEVRPLLVEGSAHLARTVPVHAAPHERVLLDLLFTDKHGPRTSVTFSELARTFASSRRWKRLKEAIAAELRVRAAARRRSRTHARPRDGHRPDHPARRRSPGSSEAWRCSIALEQPVLAVPIALLIVGVVGMITGASLSPLSEDGHRRAERWRAFKRTLGSASEGRQAARRASIGWTVAAVRGGLRHGPRVDETSAEAGSHGRPVLARGRHPGRRARSRQHRRHRRDPVGGIERGGARRRARRRRLGRGRRRRERRGLVVANASGVLARASPNPYTAAAVPQASSCFGLAG